MRYVAYIGDPAVWVIPITSGGNRFAMGKGSIKGDFPLLDSVVHLASASRGPLPGVSLKDMTGAMAGMYSVPDDEVVHLCENSTERCRKLASRLLGCNRSEVAMVFNTTHGINSLASGIDWERGDVVVLPDIEYPANVVPWLNQGGRGVRVRVVPTQGGMVDPDVLESMVDEKTRVVALSHVEFSNGFRNDLRSISELVHGHGGLLFVDAAQSLGVVETDVRRLGIDSLSTCGYKWLCSPPGTGIFYLRKDLVGEVKPAYAGFESVDPEMFRALYSELQRDGWTAGMDYPPSPGANRFEFGEPNLIPNVAFARSMEYLLGLGKRRVEKRSSKIVEYLLGRLGECGYDVLTPADPSMRAGIVTFRAGDGEIPNWEVARRLREMGILVSARYGGIRISCHVFNDSGDVDSLLDGIDEITRGGPSGQHDEDVQAIENQ